MRNGKIHGNNQYINDRKNFIRQSSTAGRNFISQEIPRIKKLLQEAEANLNNFKISTNKSDIIFDADTRNLKLERLRNRVNEISFKELELKEFYKENHPIYLTLSEQKKLVLTQKFFNLLLVFTVRSLACLYRNNHILEFPVQIFTSYTDFTLALYAQSI